MNKVDYFNIALKHIHDCLRDDGFVEPHIFLHAMDREIYAINKFRDADVAVQSKIRSEIIAGIQSGRACCKLDAVVMIAESWMSTISVGKEALMGVMRPEQDPMRKECIVVHIWARDGKKCAIFELIRKGKAVSLGKDISPKDSEIKCWLDSAFV